MYELEFIVTDLIGLFAVNKMAHGMMKRGAIDYDEFIISTSTTIKNNNCDLNQHSKYLFI